MADTDSYEHLYDLPETTSAIDTDVIPIEQSDGTKKITKANLLNGLAKSSNFASEYSPSAKYAVSAYCTYQNVLYKCKTAITTPEAWNAAHWTAARVMDEIAYPVGAIYLSVNSTSPAELFGGTWEQIKDTFLLACGNTYSAGSTGGEAQHKLTYGEMPAHSHEAGGSRAEDGTYLYQYTIVGVSDAGAEGGKYWTVHTAVSGGDQPHNNMPPYVAIYAWKRIA